MLAAAANSGIAAGGLPALTGFSVDAPVVASEKQVGKGFRGSLGLAVRVTVRPFSEVLRFVACAMQHAMCLISFAWVSRVDPSCRPLHWRGGWQATA